LIKPEKAAFNFRKAGPSFGNKELHVDEPFN
jgi:hypothetical protein